MNMKNLLLLGAAGAALYFFSKNSAPQITNPIPKVEAAPLVVAKLANEAANNTTRAPVPTRLDKAGLPYYQPPTTIYNSGGNSSTKVMVAGSVVSIPNSSITRSEGSVVTVGGNAYGGGGTLYSRSEFNVIRG